jgi:hypothetical protein
MDEDGIRETRGRGTNLLFPLDQGLGYCGPQSESIEDLPFYMVYLLFYFYVGYLTTLSLYRLYSVGWEEE